MIRLTTSPASDRAWRELEQMFASLAAPTPTDIRPVQDAIREGFEDNFDGERAGDGPAWQPLALSTANERRRLGYGPYHPILVRTGDYRDSFLNPGHPDHVSELVITGAGWTVAEGSEEERVDWLEYGTIHIPARPALELGRQAKERIEDALEAMFVRMFEQG